MIKRGYPEAAARIQELFLAGRKEEAADAVPDEFVDEGALIGPVDRIRERFTAWLDSGATGLTIGTRGGDRQLEALELMAKIADIEPRT